MTRAILTGVLGSVVLVLLGVLPARAAEAQPQAYAVVVGVSDYADNQIKPRPHAEDDAKAIYDVLTDKDYLGLDSNHIRLLLGKEDATRHSQPATHENVVQALRWAASRAGREDLVIFAFIGQAAPLGERTCYFAADSTFKDRAKNAVAEADMESALEKLKSQRFCAFIDANFKGFDTGKDPAPDLNLQNFVKFPQFLGNNEEHPPIGHVVIVADGQSILRRGANPSLDREKHGLFTEVLVKGLKGAADKEGYEPDGLVTVDELVEYLDKELPEMARQYGKTKEEQEQFPLVLEGESSHFVLTRNPAVAAKVQERLDKLAKLAKDEKISRELADEGQRLLERMPKLESYRSLRKDYQKLVDGKLSVDDFLKHRSRVLQGTKMKRSAALEYAAKIIQATEIVGAEYVREVNQGELVAWAIRGLYQSVEEKIPQDIKERLDQAKDLKEGDLTVLVADARQGLGKREDLDNHKDIDHALYRMLRHLDPYTTYIDPETLARFKQETQGNFTGIGIQIRKDSTRDALLVVTPIKDSPAYRKGIKAGDVITQIVREQDSNGRPLDPPEVISTKGLPLSDAVKKILGKPRTKVKLVVERKGESKPLTLEITRGLVELETAIGVRRKNDDSWDYVIDPDNRICYVRLIGFTRNTYRDLYRVLNQVTKQGEIKGLILDLRFNPGGLLQSAVDISNLFIDDGVIVKIRPRAGKETSYSAEPKSDDTNLLRFPMVCLINGQSASGSEIVAACLQDHNRAVIVGDRSYGKGSVQNIQPFEDGELKLTTASFWRPSERNLNKSPTSREEDDWGVIPDKGYALKLPRKERFELEEHLKNLEIIPRRDLPPEKSDKPEFKDRQLEIALSYLRDQIKTASRAPSKKAG